MLSSVFCQHFQTTSPLKSRSRLFSYFAYSFDRSMKQIIVFFVPVGQELWLLWQLIVSMGKEEIDNFSVSMGIFGFF